MTALSIYGALQLNVDFKITYLISEQRPVRKYIDNSEKLFNMGDILTIYTELEPKLEAIGQKEMIVGYE
jgi:predicted RND superfamily exporter protein